VSARRRPVAEDGAGAFLARGASPRGNATRCTPEAIEAAREAFADGGDLRQAAKAIGITLATAKRWLTLDEEPYLSFRLEVDRATARAQRAAAGRSPARRRALAAMGEAGARCAYCGAGGPLLADSVWPLTRGGGRGPANIAPACEPCFSAKGERIWPTEWAPSHPEAEPNYTLLLAALAAHAGQRK
jgi:hypothetical protein